MTPSKTSKNLEKLMESADISFEDGKHYVKSAYEQAIKEGFSPQEADKLLYEKTRIINKYGLQAQDNEWEI
jgi:hypothetical protein